MKSGPDVFGVGRIDEDAVLFIALAHGFAGAPELGDDRGKTRCHRLQRGEPERLVERR